MWQCLKVIFFPIVCVIYILQNIKKMYIKHSQIRSNNFSKRGNFIWIEKVDKHQEILESTLINIEKNVILLRVRILVIICRQILELSWRAALRHTQLHEATLFALQPLIQPQTLFRVRVPTPFECLPPRGRQEPIFFLFSFWTD